MIKFQAPNKFQIPIIKSILSRFWILDIGYSLNVGAW
jgi:hypothetical protein